MGLITYQRNRPDALDPLTCLKLLANGRIGIAEAKKTLAAWSLVPADRESQCMDALNGDGLGEHDSNGRA
jgi:hypothetical protein